MEVEAEAKVLLFKVLVALIVRFLLGFQLLTLSEVPGLCGSGGRFLKSLVKNCSPRCCILVLKSAFYNRSFFS
jgi:hypothetical protein